MYRGGGFKVTTTTTFSVVSWFIAKLFLPAYFMPIPVLYLLQSPTFYVCFTFFTFQKVGQGEPLDEVTFDLEQASMTEPIPEVGRKMW